MKLYYFGKNWTDHHFYNLAIACYSEVLAGTEVEIHQLEKMLLYAMKSDKPTDILFEYQFNEVFQNYRQVGSEEQLKRMLSENDKMVPIDRKCYERMRDYLFEKQKQLMGERGMDLIALLPDRYPRPFFCSTFEKIDFSQPVELTYTPDNGSVDTETVMLKNNYEELFRDPLVRNFLEEQCEVQSRLVLQTENPTLTGSCKRYIVDEFLSVLKSQSELVDGTKFVEEVGLFLSMREPGTFYIHFRESQGSVRPAGCPAKHPRKIHSVELSVSDAPVFRSNESLSCRDNPHAVKGSQSEFAPQKNGGTCCQLQKRKRII